MLEKGRWVLLEHKGAPDDVLGIHFDLLIEDQLICRTWRLLEVPILEGPSVPITPLNPHRLEWLDIESKVLTRNRGKVKRVAHGTFLSFESLVYANYCVIALAGTGVEGKLEITDNLCKLMAIKK